MITHSSLCTIKQYILQPNKNATVLIPLFLTYRSHDNACNFLIIPSIPLKWIMYCHKNGFDHDGTNFFYDHNPCEFWLKLVERYRS